LPAIAFLFRKSFGAWGDKRPALAETLMAKGKSRETFPPRLFLRDFSSTTGFPWRAAPRLA
jgi:hypothetical protein